ncbi:hypothetical protein GC177_06305 [bacterium]|nr:hypothetical protein [bacterium]
MTMRRKLITVFFLTLIGLGIWHAQAEPVEAPVEHRRGEEQTYLTFPEWWIVYSSDDYARFIKDHPPSDFPYWHEIAQFWSGYGHIIDITGDDRYQRNIGYHVMVLVIGTSLTVEYAVKSVYENTLGRLSEWSRDKPTEEDEYAAKIAADYVDFIRVDPWYLYDFGKALRGVWDKTGFSGPDKFRKIERKFALSFEYGFKAAYAWIIKLATHAAYDAPVPVTATLVSDLPDAALASMKDAKPQGKPAKEGTMLLLPRYQAFTARAQTIAEAGGNFHEIAGNRGEILLSAIAPKPWDALPKQAAMLFSQPILIDETRQRLVIRTQVGDLAELLRALHAEKIEIEHIYDY